ncbi:fertilization-independent endosperm protein [Arabis alpina]|uniref:Fertilization-independent endosperm protein n=1 Tax=Arabis alpina TaxID=50452 RepID=A0A087HB89_ARAAL|nr:fertilization-independent endosperm protein [Arabis alpina]
MSKVALGHESLVGSLLPSNKKSYKVTNRIQEGKKPLYALVFNFLDARFFTVFAVAGGNRITLYNCLEDGAISALQSYSDEDKDESFYTVSWACSVNGDPFVAAGGLKGIIRVIDVNNEMIHKSLVGHGDSVNEIRTQPLKPQLVITASKDESVRLWNVETGICILIFAGAGGHRYEVLSVDFHPSDIYRFTSCGMDTTIKIWSMKEFWTYVEKSFTWTDDPSKFPTKFVQFPVFTASVHTNYVDCNRWFGDFILSKSVDNEILLWEPQLKENSPGEGTSDVLQRYPIPLCDIWFIKFSCDLHFNALAIGNQEGKIYVWDLKSCPPVLITKLSHHQSKYVIRQTAMSVDGSTILAGCEDGTIWRWDVVTK